MRRPAPYDAALRRAPRTTPPPTVMLTDTDTLSPDAAAADDSPGREPPAEPAPPPRPDPDANPDAPGALAWAFRAVVVLVLVAVGVGGFVYLVETAPHPAVVDPQEAALAVPVFEVRPVEVARQWRGYGTAEPVDSADVPARVSATVERIADDADPGARVEADQPLVWLDDSDFVQQVTIAEQRLAEIDAALDQLDTEEASLKQRLELEEEDVSLARAELDRLETLEDRGVANQQDLDDGRRMINTAKRSRLATQEALDSTGPRRRSLLAQQASLNASIEIARLNQQRCTITSPLAGVLQSVDVEVGEALAAGQRVARVVAPSPVEVPIRLPASARATLDVGDPVTLRATAGGTGGGGSGGGSTWTTTVARIAPEEDPQTRTIVVYAVVADEPDRQAPTPGAFLGATIASGDAADRLAVPRRAKRGGRVQVIRDGVAQSVAVDTEYDVGRTFPQTGLPDDQWSVLTGGLSPGDLVVVNSGSLIADGQRVDPRLPQADGGGEPSAGTNPSASQGSAAAPPVDPAGPPN